jgi:aminoglycoside/choline kinase family phosphotransferase
MNQPNNIQNNLSLLFTGWCGLVPETIQELPQSGSSRKYFRLQEKNISAIGVYNSNYDENVTFINFTKQFLESRINVPEIYLENLDENIYLIQDLGDTQLLSWLISNRTGDSFPKKAIEIYKKVIQELVRIQIVAGRNFDYSKCYQHTRFDKESIQFDLNYFRTNYVDALRLKYNKSKLQTDFDIFSKYLLNADNNYFMFRDFQSRNIMMVNETPFFIDYQGGRKGALQYDLVSLLFQAKAQIPEDIKLILLEHYIKIASLFIPINRDEFIEFYFGYALIRVLQTLGAYGLRGLIENKSHFIESIPMAISNLVYLKDKVRILNQLEELKQVIDQIIHTEIKTNG